MGDYKFQVGDLVTNRTAKEYIVREIIHINTLLSGADMLIFSRDRRQMCFAGHCRLATRNEIKLAEIKKCFKLK
jgi:hypothetical protein